MDNVMDFEGFFDSTMVNSVTAVKTTSLSTTSLQHCTEKLRHIP